MQAKSPLKPNPNRAAARPQVVHESEVHRQHVRLKIPIQVEVDGMQYRADDWSVGGFGVSNVVSNRRAGEKLPVKLSFPFDDFELSLRLDCLVVYVNEKDNRFGCRFLELKPQQINLFRYVVEAYLSGELVSLGDILHLRGREGTAEARREPLFDEYERRETTGRRVRRALGYTLAALAGLVLIALVGLGVREQYFTVRAETAVIEAPLVRLRAPITGSFEPTPSAVEGARVAEGETLAIMRGPDGTLVTFTSPCACVVLEVDALRGQYYQLGERLLTLVEADAAPLVRAQLPLEEAEELRIGDPAEFRIAGASEVLRGQVERVDLQPARFDPGAGINRRLAQVIVRPDRPLDLASLGLLVRVNFP